jgi:hypothetical protein
MKIVHLLKKTGRTVQGAYKAVVRNAVAFFKLSRNISNTVFDNYILSKLDIDNIHNDLGASFTSIVREKKYITKKANDRGEAKLIDEINWYLLFRKSGLSPYLPKINNYSTEPGNVFYKMRYYNFPNLRKLIIDEGNAPFVIKRRFKFLLNLTNRYLYTEANSIPAPADFMESHHLTKLDSRMEEIRKYAPFLVPVLEAEKLVINGSEYLNAPLIISAIRDNAEIRSMLTPERLYYAHGDLHCNNILCGLNYRNNILLDCRGKSPAGSLYFDPSYDIAKIYHDLRSFYSLIEKHLFSIFMSQQAGGISIEFEYLKPELCKKFHYYYVFVQGHIQRIFKRFKNLQYRADFTEAMLYLTMVPLHLKTKAEGLMCYTTGLLRLNRWLKIHHPAVYAELTAKTGLKERSE